MSSRSVLSSRDRDAIEEATVILPTSAEPFSVVTESSMLETKLVSNSYYAGIIRCDTVSSRSVLSSRDRDDIQEATVALSTSARTLIEGAQ